MMTDGIQLINKQISKKELKDIASQRFGDMVKGVVDVQQEIMTLGADLHADEEAFMLQNGSKQSDLWGINLYPDLDMPDMLEYDSMINIRPQNNNRSRDVEDKQIREKILQIVEKLIAT